MGFQFRADQIRQRYIVLGNAELRFQRMPDSGLSFSFGLDESFRLKIIEAIEENLQIHYCHITSDYQ